MRGVQIFSGTSHPELTAAICERLGTSPSKCELGKFSNGEISVNIDVSVRNQDVFVVQSGSSKINDSLMELLIMINACKGGSAKSITVFEAVMPYFPYSRQSKKKSHRGAVTARMLANLLSIAGVDHVITVDLHASQMQGFFGKPVDNLFAEPLIARWIRINVPRWNEAVVVSKNAGGSKRVTSLADTLKLNFGIATTDRRRQQRKGENMTDSALFFDAVGPPYTDSQNDKPFADSTSTDEDEKSQQKNRSNRPPTSVPPGNWPQTGTIMRESRPETEFLSAGLQTPYTARRPSENDISDEECTDERAREVITARLVQGHLVDDDYPSPADSPPPSITMTDGNATVDVIDETNGQDSTTLSGTSAVAAFEPEHALGGSFDAGHDSDDDDEKIRDPKDERTITLVGDVKDKTVFIVDDLIDSAGSWIAAAETVVKRGGADKVYCIATHGLFGGDSLERLEACQSIDYIVIANSFPIAPDKVKNMQKLIVLDLSALLSESIRRHHYGESISSLFQPND